MCKLSNQVCLPGPGFGEQLRANLKRFSGLLVLALLLGLCPPAHADLGDDQYLQIYSLIQQADDLSTSGKAAPAKAKYQEAQTALKSFKRTTRTWNVKLVSYRLNYVAQKLAALSEKPRAAAAGRRHQRAGGATRPRARHLHLDNAGQAARGRGRAAQGAPPAPEPGRQTDAGLDHEDGDGNEDGRGAKPGPETAGHHHELWT